MLKNYNRWMANVRTNFSTKNDFDVNNGTEGPAGD